MEKFNPKDWLSDEEDSTSKRNASAPKAQGNSAELAERALQAIEKSATDITGDYATWLNIGFALAEEFGESPGRDYYHRVSRFGPTYEAKACDRQFERCLKSKGSGISFGTFVHHVKAAGIKIPPAPPASPAYPEIPVNSGVSGGKVVPSPAFALSGPVEDVPEQEEEDEKKEILPVFPDNIYGQLPSFLQKVVEPATGPEERDILLLGSLASLSACLPRVYGIYDGRKVFSNLYLFVTAPASSGKGRLNLCKQLVQPIHASLRQQVKELKQEYETQLALYNADKKGGAEKPVKPMEKMLLIPANNSSTGVLQLLSDNDGRGLIFETEADSMTNALKSDYGDYSDGFRKAFHHETISYFRRTDREYVDLDAPALSTVLSGTPRQITNLIPFAENGLFSRFIFYYMNLAPVWKDVFADSDSDGIEAHYQVLGQKFHELYKQLNNFPPMKIQLSRAQKQRFNTFFSQLQLKYLNVHSNEYVATIRRLGLICFRFCMILSAMRVLEDKQLGSLRQCEDRDFDTALTMISILVKHSSSIYYRFPPEKRVVLRSDRKERFLERLPKEFTKQQFCSIAQELNIPQRTAENYIARFMKSGLISREMRDRYLNEFE